MSTFSDYSDIVVNSLLRLQEGEALSINTEEKDFEFAKVLADVAVRVSKTTAKIVVTNDGKPLEVVDFDPYVMAVPVVSYCMLHLTHFEEKETENTLDVLVDKDDLRSIQKLGHLADPIILNRRIAIVWCVIPAFYANSKKMDEIVEYFSSDFESLALAAKYRKRFMNHADIDSLHFIGENCDFSVEIPDNVQFCGGESQLANGRAFYSGIDFQRLVCNVKKNSINGWFKAKISVFGKEYDVKLTFIDGVLSDDFNCSPLKHLLSFDPFLAQPGFISLNDKEFSIVFGCSEIDSLVCAPDSVDDLPDWFNESLYRFECKLEDKLSIMYKDCAEKEHELVRKGFFLE